MVEGKAEISKWVLTRENAEGHYESENTAKVGGNLIYIYHDCFYRNISSSDNYY